MAPGPEWLAVDTLLSAFGQRRAQAVAAYRAFVAAGKNQPSPWAKLKNQIYLGSDAFVNHMQRKVDTEQDLSEVPAAHRRQMAKPLEYYARKYADRNESIAQAYAGGGYGLKEISYVLCHQPKSFDWHLRKAKAHPLGKLPGALFAEVCERLNQTIRLG
jgi:hypothetical protein